MRRAVQMVVVLSVLALVVIVAGCGGSGGGPGEAAMDTAAKPPPPPPPATPTPCKLICFKYTSYRPVTTDLLTMYTNGTGVQMLSIPNFYGNPAYADWAPGGERVVLSWNSLLYTALPDGTDLVQFTTGAEPELEATNQDADPDWGASGIVFKRRTGDYDTPNRIAEMVICLKRLDGSAAQLTAGYQDSDPCWSPDGDYVVFRRFGATAVSEFQNGLYVVSAQGGTPVPLGTSEPIRGYYPSWGRDAAGQLWIAYQNGDHGLSSVPVSADGTVTGPVRLHPGAGSWASCPAWSPDGTQIAFHEEDYDKKGNLYFETYVLTVASDTRVKIGAGGLPAWSPPVFGGS